MDRLCCNLEALSNLTGDRVLDVAFRHNFVKGLRETTRDVQTVPRGFVKESDDHRGPVVESRLGG